MIAYLIIAIAVVCSPMGWALHCRAGFRHRIALGGVIQVSVSRASRIIRLSAENHHGSNTVNKTMQVGNNMETNSVGISSDELRNQDDPALTTTDLDDDLVNMDLVGSILRGVDEHSSDQQMSTVTTLSTEDFGIDSTKLAQLRAAAGAEVAALLSPKEVELNVKMSEAGLAIMRDAPKEESKVMDGENMAELAAILKTSIAKQEEQLRSQGAAGLSAQTISALQSGDFKVQILNLEGILGKPLHSLATALGINVTQELAGVNLQGMFKKLLATLKQDLSRLDADGIKLQEQLRDADAKLLDSPTPRNPVSSAFIPPDGDGLKQEDNSAADEVEGDALEQVRESAARLQRVMRSYNEDADLLTALAMFPLRSVGKQLSFVLGLTLLLKVPFDLLRLLISGNSGHPHLAPEDWLALAGQAAACVACFQYFGLWRALWVSATGAATVVANGDKDS